MKRLTQIKLNQTIKSGLLLGVTTCSLIACNTGTTSSSGNASNNMQTQKANAAADSSILKNDLYLMRIGGGYDNTSNTVTSGQTCLANGANQNNIYIANPSALITFDQTQETTALQNALNVDVSSQYGGDRFGFSMAANFANASKDNDYTSNIVYLYQYAGRAVYKDGTLGHGMGALTPEAAALEETSPTKFRTMCGNEFIEQINAGVVLGVRLSLSFNSHSDQEKFQSEFNLNLGLANISAAIQQAAANSNIHVNLTLSALQLGGQPEKLNEVFGLPDSSGNYPLLQCETNGQQGSNACNLMISNIINYAQTLKTQLANNDGSLNLDRLYYSNPILTPYENLGIATQGAPDPSSEIMQAMQQLTIQYDKAVSDYTFVNHYLSVLPNKLDDSVKQSLSDAAQSLREQISNVYLQPAYHLTDCYRGYVSTECLKISDNVNNALANYTIDETTANLITYLEHNSYTGKILNYYGGATPTATDYRMSDSTCVFAPVSDAGIGHFAINCDGKWLTTNNPDGITILSGFDGNEINVQDLAYISTPPNSNANGQLIMYEDKSITSSATAPNSFLSYMMTINASNFFTSDAKLQLVRWSRGPNKA